MSYFKTDSSSEPKLQGGVRIMDVVVPAFRTLAVVGAACSLLLPGEAAARWSRPTRSTTTTTTTTTTGTTTTGTTTTGTTTGSAYYVSPTGSDSNPGTYAQPFRTPDMAMSAMESSNIKTTYLMGGTYSRTVQLKLTPPWDNGETWLAYPGQTPIFDGGGRTNVGFLVEAPNVTIRWLTFQNFTDSAIKAWNSPYLFVDSNTVLNTRSSGWAQGGIEVDTAPNTTITHNLVRNSNSTGITGGDDVPNLLIQYNAVYNSCITVVDCGAIYSVDRPRTSNNVRILNNIVGQYGTSAGEGIGIYLDDYLSGATVKNNIVYGSGQYGLTIHGGSSNLIQNNIFDITLDSPAWAIYWQLDNTPMSPSTVTCNIVYTSGKIPKTMWTVSSPNILPSVSKNLYWATTGSMPNVAPVIDTQPTYANPGFVNPAGANYTLASGAAPTTCGFVPFSTATVGPLPH